MLASYKSTRPGLQGIANRLILLRLRGPYSHTEVVFEPDDVVDHLMPDGTCAPDADGALWCASSVAAERLPAWSPRRAGRIGGVRFKRISINPDHWDLLPYRRDPVLAAEVFKRKEGEAYSWRLILGWVGWLVNVLWRPSRRKSVCSQIAAEAGGAQDAWRFDPCVLHAAVAAEGLHRMRDESLPTRLGVRAAQAPAACAHA